MLTAEPLLINEKIHSSLLVFCLLWAFLSNSAEHAPQFFFFFFREQQQPHRKILIQMADSQSQTPRFSCRTERSVAPTWRAALIPRPPGFHPVCVRSVWITRAESQARWKETPTEHPGHVFSLVRRLAGAAAQSFPSLNQREARCLTAGLTTGHLG